jgi:hypothetical protein
MDASENQLISLLLWTHFHKDDLFFIFFSVLGTNPGFPLY